MSEFEKRNEAGMPVVEMEVPDNRGNVHQQVDQSVNKSMPWIVLAVLVGALGAGLAIANMPRQSDMSARLSDQQAQFNARIEDLVRANNAKEQEVRMLEYYVMEVDGKLMQRNIIRPNESWSGRKLKSKRKE